MDVARVQRPSLAAAAPRAQLNFEVGFKTDGIAALEAKRVVAIARDRRLTQEAEQQLAQALLRLRQLRTGPLAVVELLAEDALELSPPMRVERSTGLLQLLSNAETHVATVVQGIGSTAESYRAFVLGVVQGNVRFSLHEEPASAISWASHRAGASRSEVAELLGLAQSLAARP
jgi:hypothetical protein